MQMLNNMKHIRKAIESELAAKGIEQVAQDQVSIYVVFMAFSKRELI